MRFLSSPFCYLFLASLTGVLLQAQVPPTSPETPEEEEQSRFDSRQRPFANLEFLYWTVQEGALEYAIHNKSPAWGPTPAFAKGNYKRAHFDWAPGLRVSAGFYRAPHYWEAYGQYTWIFVDGSDDSHKPSASDEFIEATWNEFTPTPLDKAKSHISLHYHVGDLFVSRVFDTNPHLRLRLLGALTTAYIEQRWRVRYSDDTDNHDVIKNHWRFCGTGLRIGFSVDWFWGYHIYFTGKTTIAGLTGAYKNRAFQKTTFAPSATDNVNIPVRNIVYEDHRFALNVQMMLGPSYQQMFSCFDLELFAGYEFNIWTNLQEVYRSAQTAPAEAKENKLSTGNLGLHGLTMRLTLGF